MTHAAKDGSYVAIPLCFYCGEKKNEVILNTRLKPIPQDVVYNKEPCDKCKDWMAKGIMLIETRDGETGDNPFRTGRLWVIGEEAAKRAFGPESLLEQILKCRFSWIEESAAKKSGLHDMPGVGSEPDAAAD
jgi:hypothetical protein